MLQGQQRLNILLVLLRQKRKFKSALKWKLQLFYINGVKIHQFKAKYSEMKPCSLCLGNIIKYFAVDDMENTELNEYVYDFSFHYNTIDVSNIVDIHKYLKKKNII